MSTTDAPDVPDSAAEATAAQLSIQLRAFAADDPGDWQPLLDLARAADAGGIDRVVVSDHVAFGENLEAYGHAELGGIEGGKQPTGPDGHWLEPMTVLTTVAAITSRVRLMTGILQAALRRPIVLAKTAATLDVLSGGRLDLGVGVGWQREEYEAAGLDFDRRGRQLDHTLEVCQAAWREPRISISSPELTVDGIHAMPKPRQPGGVPIWVSGTVNPRVVRRLGRFGSGWVPWGPAAADIGVGIAGMRQALTDAGHDPTGLQVTGNLRTVRDADGRPDLMATMRGVPALVEAGVTDLRLALRPPDGAALDSATDWFAEVVGTFRATAAT